MAEAVVSQGTRPRRRACVIGAGASGLPAIKALRERGVPADAYEMGSEVGGLWRYGNDNGRSAAYASLRANTSKTRTGYAAFPLPDDVADYPHHSDVRAWLETYADRFGLRESIAFRTQVVRVAPPDPRATGGAASGGHLAPWPGRELGAWDVTVRDLETGRGRTRRYDAVLVASGHHWDPHVPDVPGTFEGMTLHSRRYRAPDGMEGRRVLVVGMGNSACDIACEVAGVARRTLLSTRRGAHVLPKFLFGRPLDRWITPLSSRLPMAVQRRVLSLLVRLDRGPQEAFGLPVPDHPLGAEHPTISQELPRLAREGRVVVKPDLERLAGSRVRFVDGSEEPVDVIVWATGYRVAFPFLSPLGPEVARPPGNRLPLYLHVVPPELSGLYFIGLVQPLGAIPPLAEVQAEWVADLVSGRAALPSPEAMRRSIEEQERELVERYVDTKRHTMEVDVYPYLRAVRRERRRGARRARAAEAIPGGA